MDVHDLSFDVRMRHATPWRLFLEPEFMRPSFIQCDPFRLGPEFRLVFQDRLLSETFIAAGDNNSILSLDVRKQSKYGRGLNTAHDKSVLDPTITMFPHVRFTAVLERQAAFYWSRIVLPLATVAIMSCMSYAPTSTGLKWETVDKMYFNAFCLFAGFVVRTAYSAMYKLGLTYSTLDDGYSLGVLCIMVLPLFETTAQTLWVEYGRESMNDRDITVDVTINTDVNLYGLEKWSISHDGEYHIPALVQRVFVWVYYGVLLLYHVYWRHHVNVRLKRRHARLQHRLEKHELYAFLSTYSTDQPLTDTPIELPRWNDEISRLNLTKLSLKEAVVNYESIGGFDAVFDYVLSTVDNGKLPSNAYAFDRWRDPEEQDRINSLATVSNYVRHTKYETALRLLSQANSKFNEKMNLVNGKAAPRAKANAKAPPPSGEGAESKADGLSEDGLSSGDEAPPPVKYGSTRLMAVPESRGAAEDEDDDDNRPPSPIVVKKEN